ncbi:MAG TPA: hypothetical protein P5125_09400 [Kiritimatiellia bacterium]|jgi:DNA polymerase-3 subunit delta|nr:hypothetical protein [Kiritimatiellia bacterium]HOM58416.1 hypothetical protein [Kiritimatiellia bacterium]HOR98306.1 hypothetical protein [Kiritimatiellia bacterium]HPC48877.1 hypothetical protein [Kiritimatiellia bacterium]HPW75490.1 hypothetical protein [Kiritimatiellia bacterium]
MNGFLCLICGDDDYLVEAAARERIARFLPEADRALGLEIIDGRRDTGDEARKAAEACMESVQTPGFFGAVKVTWLRNATFLTGGGRVAESLAAKEAVERLTIWLKGGLEEGQVLVITAARILRSSKFFKLCQKQGEVEDFGGNLKSWELEKRASQRLDGLLKKAGLTLDEEAYREFLNRVGWETRLLVQEVEKLRLYIGASGRVTIEDVRTITSVGREAEAWDLLDAFGERKPAEMLKALSRMDGQKGIGIMLAVMLEKRVRELLVLRAAYDRKWLTTSGWQRDLPPEAVEQLAALPVNDKTMSAWMLKKRMPQVLAYSLQELRGARFRLLDLREKLVSTGLPERFLIETVLLRIMARRAVSRPAARQRVAGAR